MAYPFAAAEVLTAANLNAMIGAPTQNNQTGTTYTLALLDAGKTVTLSNASPVTVTIPAQATVTWANNTQIHLLNIGAGLVTIAGAVGVTVNGTPLTLAQNARGILIRTASNTWTFVPNASGSLTSSTASVLTQQTTTSTSYTDLATAGPAVTVTTGTKALVMINAEIYGGAGFAQYMSFAVSGATTVAASDNFSIGNSGTNQIGTGTTFLVTGLTAGSNVFTVKYRVTAGTGVYQYRRITVVDMGS